MKVFARRDLIGDRLQADEPAVLLEGSWPGACAPTDRWSLDDQIDARYARIDQHAIALAEQLAGQPGFRLTSSAGQPGMSLAWLNALSLRYYLVRLLRVAAFFRDVLPIAAEARWEMFLDQHADADYADVLTELARLNHCRLKIHELPGKRREISPVPNNGSLRRMAARVNAWLHVSRRPAEPGPVVLCGNPLILDPVCRELVAMGESPIWLYDRFAFRAWARWRHRGVRQVVCQSAEGQINRFQRGTGCCDVQWEGINLSAPLNRWLEHLACHRGTQQTRMLEQIELHFRLLRPSRLVLDQDATPLARACVHVARVCEVPSIVVQHGAPRVRFGFAPLEADRICVWGRSSAGQLQSWGVPPERIRVTGSPRLECKRVESNYPPPLDKQHQHGPSRQEKSPVLLRATDGSTRSPANRRTRQIVLFATTVPNDSRPDSVGYHLTRRTHDESIRMACAAVAGIPGTRLIIKLHPRCRNAGPFERIAGQVEDLNYRIVRGGRIDRWLHKAVCVLNCGSSAGIEAVLSGLPVIELLPEGSLDPLPADRWNMWGSAREEQELTQLLQRALKAPTLPASDHVFDRFNRRAARRTAESILEPMLIATNQPLGASPRLVLKTRASTQLLIRSG